jgi:hypothetical protein
MPPLPAAAAPAIEIEPALGAAAPAADTIGIFVPASSCELPEPAITGAFAPAPCDCGSELEVAEDFSLHATHTQTPTHSPNSAHVRNIERRLTGQNPLTLSPFLQ